MIFHVYNCDAEDVWLRKIFPHDKDNPSTFKNKTSKMKNNYEK